MCYPVRHSEEYEMSLLCETGWVGDTDSACFAYNVTIVSSFVVVMW